MKVKQIKKIKSYQRLDNLKDKRGGKIVDLGKGCFLLTWIDGNNQWCLDYFKVGDLQ